MAESEPDTSAIVKSAIEEDPVVRKALERGLINVRALGREIQSSAGPGTSLDAIISAVHRYPLSRESRGKPVGKYIAKLSLRDKVTAFGLINSEETWKAISELPERVEASKGDVLRIITGVEATTVILDTKNADLVRSMVPRQSIGRTYDNLAEVIVHLDEGAWEATGVLSTLSGALTLDGVVIYYHFGYGPPPSIVFEVREDDAVKAYQAFVKLRRAARG